MKTETCSCCVILINYISCNTIMLHCAIYIHFINYWKHKVDVTPKKRTLIKTRCILYTCDVTPALHVTTLCSRTVCDGSTVTSSVQAVLVGQLVEFWDVSWHCSAAGAALRSDAGDRPAGSAKADHEVEIADCCSVWIMREAVWRKHINWQFLRGLKL